MRLLVGCNGICAADNITMSPFVAYFFLSQTNFERILHSEEITVMPYSDPKYPVVTPSPSVDDCVKSMRWKDYFVLTSVPSATWMYGYLLGKPVRFPTASTAAAIGFTFATFVVLQDTRARLMGYKENAKEVKKYGLYHKQPDLKGPVDPRFPTATGKASESTKPLLDWTKHS